MNLRHQVVGVLPAGCGVLGLTRPTGRQRGLHLDSFYIPLWLRPEGGRPSWLHGLWRWLRGEQ
jgi:hypothetical protein